LNEKYSVTQLRNLLKFCHIFS